MMLAMDCLRWITVMALRDRTWAGSRVYDSPGQPADLRMETERAPFVAVYTDDADFDLSEEAGVGAASLYDGGGTALLVIEVAVAGQMEDVEPPEDPADEPEDEAMFRPVKDRNILAATDQGLEARIGFIARQVMDALADPTSPWAELWRRIAPGRGKVEVRRGGPGNEAMAEGAQRFASRVIRIHVELLGEPAPGETFGPGAFWPDFLALAAETEEMAGIGSIIQDHLEAKDTEAWRRAQRAGTLTERGVRGIGIGPATIESKETPPLSSVVVDAGGPTS